MTPSIKMRLGQIRRGIVPKGYIKSSIGIIPENWKVISLGKLGSIKNGLNYHLSENGHLIRVLGVADFRNTSVLGSVKAIAKVPLSNEPPKESLLKDGDIVFVRSNGSRKLVGRNLLVYPKNNKVSYSGFCIRFRINNDIITSPEYLNCIFDGGILRKKLRRRNQGSSITNCNQNILRELCVGLPPIVEQRKIATILETQDKVIELYRCKIEQLRLMKKTCLGKMFPRHGRDTPEVRFQRYCKTWVRQRLGSLFFELIEKGHPELPPLTTIQGGGTVRRDEAERDLQYDTNNLSNYKAVHKGDFIVHLRSFEGGLEVATTPGLVSPAYHVFRGKGIDSRFYYAYFRSAGFINGDLKPHVYGIRDGRSIDIEGMKTIKIPHTSLKEQQKIGDCMESFDCLIALHQRKCDEEKRKKKALMQLLLTGIVRV